MIYTDLEFEKLALLQSMEEPSYFDYIKPDFFEDENIGNLFKIGKVFFKKYRSAPTKSQLKQIVSRHPSYKESITPKIIDKIYEFDEERQSCEKQWLTETLQSWAKLKKMNTSLLDAVGLAKVTALSPDNIDKVRGRMKDILNEGLSMTFENNLGVDFFDETKHYVDPGDMIPSGKTFFDNLSNGYEKGNLVSYIGQPNIGKSQFLANDAAYYVRNGYNVVLVTAEMKEVKFIKRIGANMLNIPVGEYNEYAKDPVKVRDRLDEVSIMKTPGKFRIVQMADPNVLQIEQTVKKIENLWNESCDVLIIDYLNILSDYRNPNSENTYNKLKNITKDLRDISVVNEWLVITASQINKTGYDSSSLSMSSISESQGLSMNADVIFGIIRKPERMDDKEYYLKIIKTRDSAGKDIECLYFMNWDYLRLEEQSEVLTPETFF